MACEAQKHAFHLSSRLTAASAISLFSLNHDAHARPPILFKCVSLFSLFFLSFLPEVKAYQRLKHPYPEMPFTLISYCSSFLQNRQRESPQKRKKSIQPFWWRDGNSQERKGEALA